MVIYLDYLQILCLANKQDHQVESVNVAEYLATGVKSLSRDSEVIVDSEDKLLGTSGYTDLAQDSTLADSTESRDALAAFEVSKIHPTPVPVPPAFVLFGSVIIGMIVRTSVKE